MTRPTEPQTEAGRAALKLWDDRVGLADRDEWEDAILAIERQNDRLVRALDANIVARHRLSLGRITEAEFDATTAELLDARQDLPQ